MITSIISQMITSVIIWLKQLTKHINCLGKICVIIYIYYIYIYIYNHFAISAEAMASTSTPMDMSANASQDIFMVAERAVGLAVGNLRAELGAQIVEMKNGFDGMSGELDTLRETVQNAFAMNNKTLRAEIIKSKDIPTEARAKGQGIPVGVES